MVLQMVRRNSTAHRFWSSAARAFKGRRGLPCVLIHQPEDVQPTIPNNFQRGLNSDNNQQSETTQADKQQETRNKEIQFFYFVWG